MQYDIAYINLTLSQRCFLREARAAWRSDTMSTSNEALEIEKIHAETVELRQRVNESIARTVTVNEEIRWYEVLIIVSVTLAVVGFSKLILL